jgi:hypothetical protein
MIGMVIGEQIAECGLGKRENRKIQRSEGEEPDSGSFRKLRPIANTLNRGLRGSNTDVNFLNIQLIFFSV